MCETAPSRKPRLAIRPRSGRRIVAIVPKPIITTLGRTVAALFNQIACGRIISFGSREGGGGRRMWFWQTIEGGDDHPVSVASCFQKA
ncbi:hypothetical protein NPIL_280791 [Nephila pilipes]|uniref:Uncharacterized protein n=1 Tax=Nephila pilipes TaxID=299642 RepID=A0A8X6J8R7_NEPPI|nr:hypothetical protein NPIL_280791 [Nephila pilipes]